VGLELAEGEDRVGGGCMGDLIVDGRAIVDGFAQQITLHIVVGGTHVDRLSGWDDFADSLSGAVEWSVLVNAHTARFSHGARRARWANGGSVESRDRQH